MRSRNVLLNMLIFLSLSSLLVFILFLFNQWLLDTSVAFGLSQADLFFIEGVFIGPVGFLLLLGKGGINSWTLGVVLDRSVRNWFFARDVEEKIDRARWRAKGPEPVQPSEIFRADTWQPLGFIRLGLIL